MVVSRPYNAAFERHLVMHNVYTDAQNLEPDNLDGLRDALEKRRPSVSSLTAACIIGICAGFLSTVVTRVLTFAADTTNVLDQEQDLFQSQVDLVQARRDQIIASFRVKAAVGELTVVGIDLPVEPYNPEAYYADVRNRWIGLGEDVGGARE